MNKDMIKFGLLILGAAGVVLLTPKKKQKTKLLKDKIKSIKDNVKIEPEKLNFC